MFVFPFVCVCVGGEVLDAIGGIDADEVLSVHFSRHDSDIRVSPGAFVSMRALAQRVGVDLFHLGAFFSCE